jgi:hypothetical protein
MGRTFQKAGEVAEREFNKANLTPRLHWPERGRKIYIKLS